MTGPGVTAGRERPGLHPAILYHVVNTLGWAALRPLQEAAVEPIAAGEDALLLAPTAGGKTEAAVFPVLSRMAAEDWRGLTVLYVCPLRALLNNLEPRVSGYASWLGRRAALWHGDTPASVRRRLRADRPDLLLTTPESLEAMLVSTLVTPREMFGDLRTVVVDEVHAFAGDDRGWHLLAVLERVSRVAGRPLQRVGLSATVGNPDQLLGWLQGSLRGQRPAVVVNPEPAPVVTAVVQLDYVGTVGNAAQVISALHAGEKRLVFAESRRRVEELAVALRGRGVDTYVSHSSLAADERRYAEAAFTEARNCVVVATSTLELGVDVGDLDRVVQVGTPRTVASFLQRLGRTGRRPGTPRNALFLAVSDDELLQAAGLLLLWGEGYVEPVVPPPSPRHLAAQQLLAMCLQAGQIGASRWVDDLPPGLLPSGEAPTIAEHLLATGHLDSDSGMLFVGPAAEQRYGRRNFLELVSVFTADPQITLRAGRQDVGTVDPAVLTRRVEGPRALALAGRHWLVNHIDWRHRVAWVEPTDLRGQARWWGLPEPLAYTTCEAMRRVLLGADPSGVRLSHRAADRLVDLRDRLAPTVASDATVLRDDDGQTRWWTWAGGRANAVLATALGTVAPGLVDELDRYDNRYLRLVGRAPTAELREALCRARERFGNTLDAALPDVSEDAVRQLKFAEMLPPDLARATLAARAADTLGAAAVAGRAIVAR